MTSSRRQVAVLYIHGVEADNERFADTSIDVLRREFTRIARVDADEALVVRTAFWGSVYQERQNELLRRVGARPALGAFTVLDRLAAWAGQGYSAALIAAAATVGARWLPDLNGRWRAGVSQDRRVSVSPWWLSWTPAVHPFYWNDRDVMAPIADTLARAYHRL